jgi:hypothetical protein
MLEFEARERAAKSRAETIRKLKYQVLVYTLCIIKYYVIGLLQGQVTFFRATYYYYERAVLNLEVVPVHLSFLFGLICFG